MVGWIPDHEEFLLFDYRLGYLAYIAMPIVFVDKSAV